MGKVQVTFDVCGAEVDCPLGVPMLAVWRVSDGDVQRYFLGATTGRQFWARPVHSAPEGPLKPERAEALSAVAGDQLYQILLWMVGLQPELLDVLDGWRT